LVLLHWQLLDQYINLQVVFIKIKMLNLKAFSYVELLISVAIIATIGAMVAPYMTSFLSSNNLRFTQDALISMVRKSQEYSISNKMDTTWGICLFNSNIRLYSGTCSNPSIKDDYSIPSSVTINGLTDFQFTKGLGELTSSQQIILTSRTESVVVDITPVGGIIVN